MAIPTLVTAILLIVVGVVGYVQQPADAKSPTALIPAAIGGMLAVCGLLAFNDKFRKHAMHFAAIVGLVGAIGGFMPLVRQYNKTGSSRKALKLSARRPLPLPCAPCGPG